MAGNVQPYRCVATDKLGHETAGDGLSQMKS
jgi:hypothetical protein